MDTTSYKSQWDQYYEMVMCYVEDVLVLSHATMWKIEGINAIFKLKGYKVEDPGTRIRRALQKVLTAGKTTCWEMYLDKYVQSAITNLKERLIKMDHWLPYRCDTPMSTEYHTSEDISRELNGDGIKIYQDLIGILLWAFEVGRVDIFWNCHYYRLTLQFLETEICKQFIDYFDT